MRVSDLRQCIGFSSSRIALSVALCVVAAPAFAQASGAPPSGGAVPDNADTEVIVVGSRQSQQSAINRKRDARTATDSIVADDIGSFPDRNVNEAISRIPGVALGRNEFGEGDSVAVRGNGPDLTRVELDGLGVQSTFGLGTLGADAGRSADLRELPAELVKNVDVVKGATPDMTEGSLGGSIQIRTRTGLDFRQPYFSARAGGQVNTLGQEFTPDFNAVYADQFLDNRLGVIVSGTYSKIQNNGHNYENTISGNRGYGRLIDFDNSPEKTFVYNLDSLATDAADVVFANSTETPRSLLTKSISAQSKNDCFTLFPYTAANAAAGVRNQRTLEQQTCLNQWNDYTPSLIRHFTNEQTEERYSIDARVDFRVTDELTVFAKGTIANRNIHDQNRGRTPISLFNLNAAGTFVDTTTGYPRIRSVAPNAPPGYFLYGGLNSVGNNATVGNVLNVVPGSVVVDDQHNVTQMTLTNNSVTINQIENQQRIKTSYFQGGAEYRGDRLDIDLFAGRTSADSRRADMRTERSYLYGDATLTLQPNGLWDIALPAGYDESNPANYVQLRPPTCIGGGTAPSCIGQNAVTVTDLIRTGSPAYTVGQLPVSTPLFQIQYTPRLGESTETQARLDLTYRTDEFLPFFTRFKVGGMYRRNTIASFTGGGLQVSNAVGTPGQPGYVPSVHVPRALIRASYRACQPTATSTVPCNYGFVPGADVRYPLDGVETVTPERLRELFLLSLDRTGVGYFNDLPNRPNLPAAWDGIRTDRLFEQLEISQFMNFDCVKTCVGSDGNVYDQPFQEADETIFNVYAMFDFNQQLPLGLRLDGNAGVRGVFANIRGTGPQQIDVINITPAFDPLNPGLAAGIITRSFVQNVEVDANNNKWLPMANVNLWAFNDDVVLRFYGGRTLARPPIGRLLPGGTCIIDERVELAGDGDFGCTGRVGNPGLDPLLGWNYNLSLEWYANRDTLFSATYGMLDVKVGQSIAVTRLERPYAGSDQTDPLTGRPLRDIEFLVPTWENGPGYKRSIWEFTAKTAFTFLPGFLQYTGADANISILQSAVTSGQRDPLTADLMLPPDESRYYTNASLWYDDGKLNLRVAYQDRSSRFTCITPCPGGNTGDINYPGEQWANVRLVAPGYNPGVPRFIDGSTFIDVKASYNITPNFQIYLEGRNVAGEAQTVSTGGYTDFADGTPKLMRLSYGGRRILGGVRVQFGR